MLLLELPFVLVQDIVLAAACASDPYNACRLREVNRFFEHVATKAIATHWLCKLTEGEAQNMLDSFRLHLIQLFIGKNDRGNNKLQSHMHSVCDYLLSIDGNVTRDTWLRRISSTLNACQFRHSNGLALKEDGMAYPTTLLQQSLHVSSLIIAFFANDVDAQGYLLSESFDTRTRCQYFGCPLEIACRHGLTDAVARMLDATNDDRLKGFDVPECIGAAVESDHEDVVILLTTRNHWFTGQAITRGVRRAAKRNNRRVLERCLANLSDSQCLKMIIQAAARNGWNGMLQRLADEGKFNTDLYRWKNHLPLTEVAEGGSLDTCKLVTSFFSSSKVQRCPQLLPAVAIGGSMQVLEFFTAHGMPLKFARYVPMLAAKNGHIDMLRYAVEHGFHTLRDSSIAQEHENPIGVQYYTLITAIAHGQRAATEMLIRRLDLDPNAAVFQNDAVTITPLIAAVDAGDAATVSLLMELGATAARSGIATTSFVRADRLSRSKAGETWSCELRLIESYSEWTYNSSRVGIQIAFDAVLASSEI
jgi:hypothetical protein